MKMLCCGVLYDTNDPETYWCIQKYIMKQPHKNYIRGRFVALEVLYVLICKKNGCTKAEIHRYGSSDEKNLIEKMVFSEQKAISILERSKGCRIAVPQKCPIQTVPSSKKVPYVYGKTISGEKQRARYLSEEGWAPGNIIYSPVKVYKI